MPPLTSKTPTSPNNRSAPRSRVICARPLLATSVFGCFVRVRDVRMNDTGVPYAEGPSVIGVMYSSQVVWSVWPVLLLKK